MQPTDQEREPERSSFTDNLRWASPFLRSLGPVLFCALATPAAETQTPVTMAKSINQLKAFYQQNCTRCHGRDGSARGADGKKLGGQDFTLAAQDFQKLRGPASEREGLFREGKRSLVRGARSVRWLKPSERVSSSDSPCPPGRISSAKRKRLSWSKKSC